MMRKGSLIFLFSGIIFFALFLYSFTQVDLNLTLSKLPLIKQWEDNFKNLGYFNRSLSTGFYLGIITGLFALYLSALILIKKNLLGERAVWKLVLLSCTFLLLSYPAFSYDLFNYLFDARIVTKYNLNPYLYKALDFPGDPWIRFMHWTHRFYPYGPSWLLLTIPLSFLGLQSFLPTLVLFKVLMGVSFLAAVYFLGKILDIIKPGQKTFLLALFALNPLILIESLVSAHHDIVMIALALMGIYLLIKEKYAGSMIAILLSIGIKFATAFLLPLWLIVSLFHWQKKTVDYDQLLTINFLVSTFIFIVVILKMEIQPWYFLWIFPFAVIAKIPRAAHVILIGLSLGLLLRYTPFLYLGNWDPPAPLIKTWVTLVPLAISVFICLPGLVKRR